MTTRHDHVVRGCWSEPDGGIVSLPVSAGFGPDEPEWWAVYRNLSDDKGFYSGQEHVSDHNTLHEAAKAAHDLNASKEATR